MNIAEIWQPIAMILVPVIIWAVRVEQKGFYHDKLIEIMKEEIKDLKTNQHNLTEMAQQIVNTLSEMKNDMKWIKETFKK
jgi:hypothetical protein